jgi:tRNA(adenine34) deaminase
MDIEQDEIWMRAALAEARAALDAGEVPVGAVVVHEGRIIGRGHNQREILADPTAHAEMVAITAAAMAIGDWRLEDCSLYVTLEPCVMCAGAIMLARIPRLVFGTADAKSGACGSLFSLVTDGRLNHQVQVTSGVLGAECAKLLQDFFSLQRTMGKK